MGIFYQSTAQSDEERLKKVLIADKHFNPERIKQVIKSDIYNILRDYFELTSDDIFVNLDITKDGQYHLILDATSNRIKIFGALPDDFS